MMTWGEYREQIRRSVLNDPKSVTWTDLALRDFCWWAMDTFCSHTALATSVTYSEVASLSLSLPENVYEPVEECGLVYLSVSGGNKLLLEPWDEEYQKRDPSRISYREWPNGTLLLSSLPALTSPLTLNYFAYYDHPVEDDDVISLPRWGLSPLRYLIAANAMSGVGVTAANIGQWDDKTDSGQPEHNPLRRQHQWFIDLYYKEMLQHPPQDRMTYWKGITFL